MKKTIAILLTFFACSELCGQELIGLSDIQWGMSMDDVLDEVQYERRHVDDYGDLVMENYNLGNGIKSKVIFEFYRDELVEVMYIAKYPTVRGKGTCKNQISFLEKASYTESFYNTLISRGYECRIGWYTQQLQDLVSLKGKREDYWNCGFDSNTLELVNDFSGKDSPDGRFKKAEFARINLKNTSTNISITINHSYNAKSYQIMGCDAPFYNEIFRLVFEPTE